MSNDERRDYTPGENPLDETLVVKTDLVAIKNPGNDVPDSAIDQARQKGVSGFVREKVSGVKDSPFDPRNQ
jgi:hypothetical protein